MASINWSGAPPGTKSFALVVDDSSAPITPFIYWLVFHIEPGTTDIQEGMLPTGARQALNSANTLPYDAPCPVGHSHMYRFTVYALSTEINLPAGASLEQVWTAIAAATIGRGTKSGYWVPVIKLTHFVTSSQQKFCNRVTRSPLVSQNR